MPEEKVNTEHNTTNNYTPAWKSFVIMNFDTVTCKE